MNLDKEIAKLYEEYEQRKKDKKMSHKELINKYMKDEKTILPPIVNHILHKV